MFVFTPLCEIHDTHYIMLYGKIGVTFVYNFALRKFRGQWSATPKKNGGGSLAVGSYLKESVPPPPPLGAGVGGGWIGSSTTYGGPVVQVPHCPPFPVFEKSKNCHVLKGRNTIRYPCSWEKAQRACRHIDWQIKLSELSRKSD